MVVSLPQKTRSIAAHSGSAQVIAAASAPGSWPDGVLNNLGACWPIALQSIVGKGGVSDGRIKCFGEIGSAQGCGYQEPRWMQSIGCFRVFL
jgi:hypothetical protein